MKNPVPNNTFSLLNRSIKTVPVAVRNVVNRFDCSRYVNLLFSRAFCENLSPPKRMNIGPISRRVIDTSQITVFEPAKTIMHSVVDFSGRTVSCEEVLFLTLTVMMVLKTEIIPAIAGYTRFTVGPTIRTDSFGVVTFTAAAATPLTTKDGKEILPDEVLFSNILVLFTELAEKYGLSIIEKLVVRAYTEPKGKLPLADRKPPAKGTLYRLLTSLEVKLQKGKINLDINKLPLVKDLGIEKKNYNTIKPLKRKEDGEMTPFMVADIETVLISDTNYPDLIQKPYAIGLLKVFPGEAPKAYNIETFYSEDYLRLYESFVDRSVKAFKDFFKAVLRTIREDKRLKILYFHNFSRFDGVFILRHLTCYQNKEFIVKPLMRNGLLYELSVYKRTTLNKKGKLLFRIRDSYLLLPSRLNSLAKNLCPELGVKGSIPHTEIMVEKLKAMQEQLTEYMKQDILLLAGIMLKAQEIYWHSFSFDINRSITLSSLAVSIYRQDFYDYNKFPIHIPNTTEEAFIRRGYYGGHADSYVPYGEGLYYYDVNSLYPFVMKQFDMPGGRPKWVTNLEDTPLEDLFGYIEAHIECPETIAKPFLPYRKKDGGLVFATGEFVDVYYSEELKYAQTLGYKITPLRGYLFNKMESPFKQFVSTMFEKRLEAKRAGKEAMSYIYKTLMNSLYGRFGINPECSITEIGGDERYTEVLKNHAIIFHELLNEEDGTSVFSYWSSPESSGERGDMSITRNAAVQLSAAVTASARIYMYPYISRVDSLYTDTDSVVLKEPLPDEIVSSTELGSLKLEHQIKKGIFMAPKSYYFITDKGENVVKHKGIGKQYASEEWFETIYKDPALKEERTIESPFRIDWKTMNIKQKATHIKMGVNISTKRSPVYNAEGFWVDTKPLHIIDLKGQDLYIENLKYKKLISKCEAQIQENDRKLLELKKSMEEMNTRSLELNAEFQKLQKKLAKGNKINIDKIKRSMKKIVKSNTLLDHKRKADQARILEIQNSNREMNLEIQHFKTKQAEIKANQAQALKAARFKGKRSPHTHSSFPP